MILLLLWACEPLPSEAEIFDPDRDGAPAESDCDNANPAVAPGQPETPYDGLDNDCNPDTPDDDLDGDGAPGATDCDDTESALAPGLSEVPYDGLDNDCDPDTPDDDLDGDGVAVADDCDDRDPSVSPEHPEVPLNGRDDDCDPSTPDASLSLANNRIAGFEDDSSGGASIALPGDTNGDGHPDLLVGAPGAWGVAYVLEGPFDADAFDWTGDVRAFSGPHDASFAGWALGAMDLTGDGVTELLVGAHRADLGAGTYSGAVFLVRADSPAGGLVDQATVTLLGGSSWDRFGRALAPSRDATGDGLPDLFVGAPYSGDADQGAVYLLAGPFTGDRGADPAELLLAGEARDELAHELQVADLDGDGGDDLIVAAPLVGEGSVLVIFSGGSARDLRPDSCDVVLTTDGSSTGFGYRALPLPDGAGAYALAIVATDDGNGSGDGAILLTDPLSPGAGAFAEIRGNPGDHGAEDVDAATGPDGVLRLVVGVSRAGANAGLVHLWEDPTALSGSHAAADADLIITGMGMIEAGTDVALGEGLLSGAFGLVVGAPADGGGALYLMEIPL